MRILKNANAKHDKRQYKTKKMQMRNKTKKAFCLHNVIEVKFNV